MTPEARLAALFAAEAPPLRDFTFEGEVMRHVAWRRAVASMFAVAPLFAAAGVLVWSLAPMIKSSAEIHALTPAVTAAGLALASAFLLIKASARFSLR